LVNRKLGLRCNSHWEEEAIRNRGNQRDSLPLQTGYPQRAEARFAFSSLRILFARILFARIQFVLTDIHYDNLIVENPPISVDKQAFMGITASIRYVVARDIGCKFGARPKF